MKKLLFAFSIIIATSAESQNNDLDNFTPLKSSGTIPAEFTTLSVDKFKQDALAIDKKNKAKVERKAQEKFYLESNYFVDELLHSGKVVFNDPISNYIQKVGEELIKHEPSLEGALRFYTVKTDVVNAITTDNGIIFVYLGLIAQLENEAQLAFILAHEITHYKEKHVINAYVETEKIEKGKKDYRGLSIDDRLLAKSNYSKELEFEADEKGAKLFSKSKYSFDEIGGVYDVLQYSYLPFDDVPFEISFFNNGSYVLPSNYTLENTLDISGDDNFNDSLSTHPNIRKRRVAINEIISNYENKNKSEFVVSETEFQKIRELARFELSKIYLNRRDYPNAIYNSYMLLKKYPGNKYLETCVAKALYGLSRYKNEGEIKSILRKYAKVEGKSQQVYYLFDKMNAEELNVLAVNYIWGLKQKYPEDETIGYLASETLKDLVYENKMFTKNFSEKEKSASEQTEGLSDSTGEKSDKKEKSKYDKIKKQKESKGIDSEDSYMRYAFVDLFKNKEFYSAFSDLEDKKNKKEKKELTPQEEKKELKEKQKEEKLLRNKGRALGIDKIVIVNPMYRKLDERKEQSNKFIDSELSQIKFSERIKNLSIASGLNADIIDSKDIASTDIAKFNDISTFNDWIQERFKHEDVRINVSDKNYMEELIKKYGTKYFAVTGTVSMRESKSAMLACIYFAGIYTIPFGLYYLLSPEYDSFIYMLVFDITTGEAVMVERKYFDYKDRNDILNSFIYDAFFQIKNKRNDKKK